MSYVVRLSQEKRLKHTYKYINTLCVFLCFHKKNDVKKKGGGGAFVCSLRCHKKQNSKEMVRDSNVNKKEGKRIEHNT